MQFSITIPLVFTLTILGSASPTISQRQVEGMQGLADLANQLNENIVFTTQFFEAFPALNRSSLSSQAVAASIALTHSPVLVFNITNQLSNNEIAQEIKGELFDSDRHTKLGLEIGKFEVEGFPTLPFDQLLSLYCSDVIPQINMLFQITGSVLNHVITIVALLPNNCES